MLYVSVVILAQVRSQPLPVETAALLGSGAWCLVGRFPGDVLRHHVDDGGAAYAAGMATAIGGSQAAAAAAVPEAGG